MELCQNIFFKPEIEACASTRVRSSQPCDVRRKPRTPSGHATRRTSVLPTPAANQTIQTTHEPSDVSRDPCGSYIRELPQLGGPAFYICLRAGSRLIPKDACIYFIRMSQSSLVLPTTVHPFPLVRDARRKAPQVVKWSLSVDPHRPRRRRRSRPEPRSWIGPWP